MRGIDCPINSKQVRAIVHQDPLNVHEVTMSFESNSAAPQIRFCELNPTRSGIAKIHDPYSHNHGIGMKTEIFRVKKNENLIFLNVS